MHYKINNNYSIIYLSFSLYSKLIVTGNMNGEINVWNIMSGELIKTWIGQEGEFISPSADSTLPRGWEMKRPVFCVKFCPNNHNIILYYHHDNHHHLLMLSLYNGEIWHTSYKNTKGIIFTWWIFLSSKRSKRHTHQMVYYWIHWLIH